MYVHLKLKAAEKSGSVILRVRPSVIKLPSRPRPEMFALSAIHLLNSPMIECYVLLRRKTKGFIFTKPIPKMTATPVTTSTSVSGYKVR